MCEATTVEVPISAPTRPVLKRILEHQGSNQSVVELTAKIDSRLMKMSKKMKSSSHGSHSLYYRVETNFAGIHLKKEFVAVNIREKTRWKRGRIKSKEQLPNLFSRLRKALARSLD